MKLLIAATIALTLTGCAGKWTDYAATNHCVATKDTMSKPVAEFGAGSNMSGSVPISVPTTNIRFEHYRRYNCSNGSIWGPV